MGGGGGLGVLLFTVYLFKIICIFIGLGCNDNIILNILKYVCCVTLSTILKSSQKYE